MCIEENVEVSIGEYVVRCKVDAIFSTDNVEGMKKKITIVDWKTGAYPSEKQKEHKRMQLALYALAYSRAHDIPIDDIEACFVYLREKQENRMLYVGHLDEKDIEAYIEKNIAQGKHMKNVDLS